ncbi:MAG: hypothetical protein ACYC0V_21355 [Armatimonadota bacterium]
MSARACAEGIKVEQRLNRRKAVKVFSKLTGWGYGKMNNIEGIKWGSNPEAWRTRFTRFDLEDLIDAGWIERDSEMCSRFEKSLEWQARVLLYGPGVYQEMELDAESYAPIPAEHLAILLRAVLSQAGPEILPPKLITDQMRVTLEQRLFDDTLFVLMVLQLSHRQEGGDEEDMAEVTRGLQQIGTQDPDMPETPYLRTLHFAYRCVASLLSSEVENLIEMQSRPSAES